VVGEWFSFSAYPRKQIVSLVFEISLCAMPLVVPTKFCSPSRKLVRDLRSTGK